MPKKKYVHRNVGRVGLDTADADTVASGSVRVQRRGGVRTKDEGVPVGICEILGHRSALIDVVPVRRSDM